MRARRLCGALAALLALLHGAAAVKLKFYQEECMTYESQGPHEPMQGSFVAMSDTPGQETPPHYDLTVTSPSGAVIHSVKDVPEDQFRIVPGEPGRYKFCLTAVAHRKPSRYVPPSSVVWDLQVHLEHHQPLSHVAADDHDTDNLWHYLDLAADELQNLRVTQERLYWRERGHRYTIESTNRRVLWYAVLRSSVLVLVSVAQVVGMRWMFRQR